MHAWEAIQKSLEFIEENLDKDFEVEDLAKTASLSTFYYQRLFSRLVKKPVREYVKLRRVNMASELLLNKELRIIDIALECGFKSHEVFTRAFKEAFGITPDEFRKTPIMLNQFDKPDLLLSYVIADEGVPLISDGLVLEMNRKTLDQPITFVGIEGFVPIDGQLPLGEATGIDLPGEVWMKFHETKLNINGKISIREVGVSYMGNAPKGYFTYFAGAEVSNDHKNNNSFKTWVLPGREYVVCGFEAENFQELVTVAINKAVKYSVRWIEKHGLTMDMYSPEIYYGSTPEATYMELWLPADEISK